MKALITGASSGIGREIALYLSDLGYDIIVVARNERALRDIQREVKTKVEVVAMDLTERENAWKLHEMYKDEPIEVLVNNAGFGVHGLVTETNLEKDLDLIDLNITALHILTKLFFYTTRIIVAIKYKLKHQEKNLEALKKGIIEGRKFVRNGKE